MRGFAGCAGNFLAVFAFLWLPVAAAGDEPHRWANETVLVANAEDPDSVEIARAYQAFRRIPEKNVILLPFPDERTVSLETFVETVVNPLRAELLERELFYGDFVGQPDVHGRRPLLLLEQRVRYLVLCRGVPLRVEGRRNLPSDQPLFERYLEQFRKVRGEAAFEYPEQVRSSAASVDSELTLLATNGVPLTAFVVNPLAGKIPPEEAMPLIRVARLDGPSKEAVLGMIEGVRKVEEKGLRGRAYFDLRGITGDSAFREGDDWIRGAAEAARTLGFDVDVDEEGAVLDESARMDAPAIYAGWYAGDVTGPFTVPGFRLAPGAIAFHLHSYSGADPSSESRHWVGPLIARGAAATVGNVYEPYLSQTHRFNVIIQLMGQGYNFGDAAYAAVPSLSWMSAVFGDPLYEPFKVSHEEKLQNALKLEEPALDAPVILGEAGRLEAAGSASEAIQLVRRALEQADHPALQLRLARLEHEHGSRRRALRLMQAFAERPAPEPQQWGLWLEAARLVDGWNKTRESSALYRKLLADERIPRNLEKTLLQEGVDATMWHNGREADAWERRLEVIEEAETREREAREAEKRAREAQAD